MTAEPAVVVADWKPSVNPWLIAVVVALAAFMEVLDSSIANVALPHICGGIGASNSEGTWVLTAYLVANAIVLPITGWISSVVGRKRFFLICISVFTICSVMCGIAPNLGILLVARILQGAGGGGMQPMAQAIMADSFPPKERGLAFALFGVTAVVAPALGPTLGGWITDNFSWRWIFLINLPVGILAFVLVSRLVEDPPFLRRFKRGELHFDGVGFGLLVVGVGALQVMLDKGQEDDWLGSRFITTMVVMAVVGLIGLVIWEWHQKQPIVDVRLFKNFNFASAAVMMFMAGVVAFSSSILMPQFLQQLAGYTSVLAGLVVSAGAAVVLVTLPVAGVLTTKVPIKYIILVSWIISAVSMYLSAKILTLNVSFGWATVMMMVEYFPVGFIFISATTASYFGVPQDRSDSVSGLSNFMRNMGSSVGTSVIQTVLARREQFHVMRLGEHVASSDVNVAVSLQQNVGSMMQLGMTRAAAMNAAIGTAWQSLVLQAITLSYMDVYMMLTVGAVAMCALSLVLRKNDPKNTEVHSGH